MYSVTGASCVLLADEMYAFVCCNKEYCYISSVFNIISISSEKFNAHLIQILTQVLCIFCS